MQIVFQLNKFFSTGQLEKRDLQSEIDKVTQKIEDAKFGVAKFLEQHYVEFNPLLVHSRELDETARGISERVAELVSRAETEASYRCQVKKSMCSTN